jgi:hypothetical protein
MTLYHIQTIFSSFTYAMKILSNMSIVMLSSLKKDANIDTLTSQHTVATMKST